jgi:hypothetical protein
LGDGESQSAITRKLNRLAGRRIGRPWDDTLKRYVTSLLQGASPGPGLAAVAGSPVDGITVAQRPHEVSHIAFWPLLHQHVARQAIVFAIQNNIQTVYDWEPRPDGPVETSIKIAPDIICITFKSPPT